MFIILVSIIKIYLFRADEEKGEIDVSDSSTMFNLPKIDAGINQKYCDSERSEMLDRTIVLKESRKSFQTLNLRDFLDWTRERNDKPTSTHRYIMQEKNPLVLKTDHLELKNECLDQFDLKFNNKDDLLINKTTINLGPKNLWKLKYSNNLMIKNLTKLLDVDYEVLLIRHLIPAPLFPSKGLVIHLPFADHINEAAKRAVNKLRPFIAIHWRMEITKPNMMPMCVKSLIKYLYKLRKELGINNIYLATDYPLMDVGGNKAQSSTFHDIRPQHHNAIKSLNDTFELNTWITIKTLNVFFDEFPGYKKELDDEFKVSGIQGIFDKLVMMDSNYFISGPEGCAHARSKFSRKIKEARTKSIYEGDNNILNDITRWPLN
ncbi:13903_t:CDS:2 [Funneliformis geosporum]|nr:13903_t:CDS:2 [Funneliformis geosporum]